MIRVWNWEATCFIIKKVFIPNLGELILEGENEAEIKAYTSVGDGVLGYYIKRTIYHFIITK